MKKSAFSLIELSIVILIIGIVVAGVTQSTSLVRKMRLQTAKNLTAASPVAGIKDLVLWYETSLESSFSSSEYSNLSPVSEWRDNSPQSPSKNNATQSNAANKPTFYENIFNSLPSVRFDGTDDFLLFNGDELIGSGYTVFVVEQRRAPMNIINTAFIGGSLSVNAENFYFGYSAETTVRFANYGHNGPGVTVGTYATPVPRIHVAQFNKEALVGNYFLNNSTTSSNASVTITSALTAFTGSAIGRTNTNNAFKYYNGDIGEIAIFSRALTSEERESVVKYLGKKFGIIVS
jgi:prepilin-type N-terminal cleavage/methylation domain-containing protein